MSFIDHDRYGIYKNYDKSGPGPALMGAGTLIGDDVVNDQEQSLGDIKEIMLDTRSGKVAYAVLSFGGFLGIGEKLFAVPWQALRLDTANKRYVLNIDKERLKTAPGFDRDAWPDMTDMKWVTQVHHFYGTDPDQVSNTGSKFATSGGVAGSTVPGAGAGSMGAGYAGTTGGGGTGGTGGSEIS